MQQLPSKQQLIDKNIQVQPEQTNKFVETEHRPLKSTCIQTLGNLIFYQHLTDSPQNQHVVLLVLQNLKSKISEESDQN